MNKKNINNICIACEEAVTNPICQDCLEREIEEWLRRKSPKLVPGLRRQTKEFGIITDFTNNIPCIFCHKKMNACAYCYINYIEEWLAKKKPELISEFKVFFNFSDPFHP